MKNVGYVMGFLAIIVVIVSVVWIGWVNAEKEYNNGVCLECGTHYELFDVECYRNGTYYIYKCKNNHVIKSNHVLESVK